MTGLSDGGWLAVAVAPFIGSFLGVVASRLPAGRSVVHGRSACDHCGRVLGAVDLIPVAGWLIRRGRCASCGGKIDPILPVIEVLAVVVPLWAATVFDTAPSLWASCVLGWALLGLAVIDARHFTLPDVLTLPLALGGLVAMALQWPSRLEAAALGAAAGAGAFWLIRVVYRRLRGREGLGLGDVKLMAAAGAWVGWEGLASLVFIAALAGLAVAGLKRLCGRAVAAGDRVPFGTFLCLGTWLVWLYGPLTLIVD